MEGLIFCPGPFDYILLTAINSTPWKLINDIHSLQGVHIILDYFVRILALFQRQMFTKGISFMTRNTQKLWAKCLRMYVWIYKLWKLINDIESLKGVHNILEYFVRILDLFHHPMFTWVFFCISNKNQNFIQNQQFYPEKKTIYRNWWAGLI